VSTVRPPPTDATATTDWDYGVYLLAASGNPATAQLYLVRAESEGVPTSASQAALFYRDLAEAHLFAGDMAAASAAARHGIDALASRSTTAQFQPDDRSLFERDLAALEAAGHGDTTALLGVAQAPTNPPVADPWYVLGWLRERDGDMDGARSAYARYVELSPAWSLLRGASGMRQHAQAVLSP
jgi:hypothetical protein